MTAGRHRSQPHPRPTEPEPEQPVDELRAALDAYALHIPSLVTGRCIARGCDQKGPCSVHEAAADVLRRAGRLTDDGKVLT